MNQFESIENIYFNQTKECVEEILSCYYSGNYRAAVVLLYSTVLNDLCLKLNELYEVEDDKNAGEILNEIFGCNESKSKWEHELIEKMLKENYITDKVKSDIDSLYNDRCFSAHPAMTHDFKLITPSKETTIAHIINMVNEVFVESPQFNKNIASKITDDLAEKFEVLNTKEKLIKYLDKHYYSRMNTFAKYSLFKSLWKFCFQLIDDDKCDRYWEINLASLIHLIQTNYFIIEEARKNEFKFEVKNNQTCVERVYILLSQIPRLFPKIEDISKEYIRLAKDNSKNILISWFLFDSFSSFLAHLNSITIFDWDRLIEDVSFKKLKEKCEFEGNKCDFLEICIKAFSSVTDFYSVSRLYTLCIKQFLNDFNIVQLESIISIICNSRVICDCWDFTADKYNEIAKTYCDKTGLKINHERFRNFKCSVEFFDSIEK